MSLAAQRRLVQQRGKGGYGAYVGIETQLLAHSQQTLFGANLGGGVVVVFGVADGSEQYGIRLHAQPMGLFGIGVSAAGG